ncbi:MAG: urease accessory protein UreD, partial [Nitratireductor sp.]
MTTAPKTSSKLDTLFSGNVTPVNATVANVSPVSVQSLNPLQLSFMQRSKCEGRLGVGFKRNSTVVENLYQQGCAKIRLPKSYDQNAEAVMINSSGGITGGDALVWNFSAGAHSNLTITTQACERIYKSSTLDVSKDSTSHKNSEAQGGSKTDLQYGKIDVCLNVGSHACLSWLPQETILFDRGALKRTLEIHLEKSSKALICESFILGRKEMDEVVESGYIKDKWRVY